MAEILSQEQMNLSIYDAMDDEQLRDILRADALNQSENDSNSEVLFYIMHLLSQRRIARGEGRDVQKAFEAFRQSITEKNLKHEDTQE